MCLVNEICDSRTYERSITAPLSARDIRQEDRRRQSGERVREKGSVVGENRSFILVVASSRMRGTN